MKIIYKIQLERVLAEEEKLWLVDKCLFDNVLLTSHILADEEFIEDILDSMDASKLLEFNVEIKND